jgi:hypothetical protein
MLVFAGPEKLIGTVLGDTYEILRIVGEGAYGTVYAARHKRLNRPVAVKVLRASDPDAFARFRREAEITSSLGSRFIAQVFDFNTMPTGEPYLVMELLEGEDMATRLARVKKLSLAEVLRIADQAATALSVAHRHQIVHRDLKPQNVYLCKTEDEGEVVKVIDFGISKVMSRAGTTMTGQFIGTPLYMSPEQVRGQVENIDERTDVYALAAVLWEALAGRAAYQAETIFELIERISGPELPPPLASIVSEIPDSVDEVLRKALAKNRDERPRTVTELYNQLANAIRSTAKVEASTPAAAIIGTHALDTMYATGMVATPLWRGRAGTDDQLRFVAPEGGFFGGDHKNRTLKITPAQSEYLIGSVPLMDGTANDLVLPHRQVSRNAARVVVRNGRSYLRREAKCSVPVRVGLSLLERSEERPLHHGQSVAVGVVAGVFHDGRFLPAQAPAGTVDEQTGLLGREGLAWEVALAARLGEGRRFMLTMGIGPAENDEAVACRVAAALHDAFPTLPVARFRGHAALLMVAATPLAEVARIATQAAAPAQILVGYQGVGESGDEAGARIDEARGALARLAATGSVSGAVDLAQHRLKLLDPTSFVVEAKRLAQRGGEVALLALDEREQLEKLGESVCVALELELLQIAGRVAGAQSVFCRPAPGAIAFVSPDAAEPIARQVAAEWHSRGPVRGEVLEVERGVAIDLVRAEDFGELGRRAAELAAGSGMGAGIESMPLPLAMAVRNALAQQVPMLRAEALTALVEAAWKLLAIGLGSMALATRRAADGADAAIAATGFAEPWRSIAIAAGQALAATPGRVGELVAGLFSDGKPRIALQIATDEAAAVRASEAALAATGQRNVARLESVVTDMIRALRPLRGWSLVAVDRVDRVDVFGDCETVHYVDYTGTYERGTPRQLTLIKDLRMGPFVYFTRFAEGIVVPLEPHLRQRPDATGAPALFWAEKPIAEPGQHRYRGIVDAQPLDDEVTPKQIPRGARR